MINARRYRGIGLVELLIALALEAALLTAVAISVHAAIQSHRSNTDYAAMTSRTRIAMLHMTNLLRNASFGDPYTPSVRESEFKKGGSLDPATGRRTGFVDDIGFRAVECDPYDKQMKALKTGEVRWNEDDKQLEMRLDNGQWQVLARQVTAFNVRLRPMQSEDARHSQGLNQHFDTVEEITISMTISPEGKGQASDVSMVSSVVPRRAAWNGEKLPLRIYTFLNSRT